MVWDCRVKLLSIKPQQLQDINEIQNNITDIHKCLARSNQKRLAIFVAFHNPSQIPQSNLNYIKILKKSLFEIVYVHNGHLEKKLVDKLQKIGCFVMDKIYSFQIDDFDDVKIIKKLTNYI